MNVFEKLIDILIALCIMLLFPVLYFHKKSELIVYQAIQERMNEFVQETGTQGEVTKVGYEQFYKLLNDFDYALTIDLQYEEYRYEPEYQKKDSTDPEFTGKVYEYLDVVPNDEILQLLYEKGDFIMNSGGYLRVSVTIVKDHKTIYAGGAIRANLSLCNYFCNYRNCICYHT